MLATKGLSWAARARSSSCRTVAIEFLALTYTSSWRHGRAKTIPVAAETSNKIDNVKVPTKAKEGDRPKQQRRPFEGTHLEDSVTLSEYNIQNEHTSHLVCSVLRVIAIVLTVLLPMQAKGGLFVVGLFLVGIVEVNPEREAQDEVAACQSDYDDKIFINFVEWVGKFLKSATEPCVQAAGTMKRCAASCAHHLGKCRCPKGTAAAGGATSPQEGAAAPADTKMVGARGVEPEQPKNSESPPSASILTDASEEPKCKVSGTDIMVVVEGDMKEACV